MRGRSRPSSRKLHSNAASIFVLFRPQEGLYNVILREISATVGLISIRNFLRCIRLQC